MSVATRENDSIFVPFGREVHPEEISGLIRAWVRLEFNGGVSVQGKVGAPAYGIAVSDNAGNSFSVDVDYDGFRIGWSLRED